MRLWSIDLSYLDAKGLVALWREGLLAQAVLRGNTKGYTKHPQLIRFQQHPEPLQAISMYLRAVLVESQQRGYRFDESKVDGPYTTIGINVSRGQVEYEYQFLCQKLEKRDPMMWEAIRRVDTIEVHPLFCVVDGDIESWEKVK